CGSTSGCPPAPSSGLATRRPRRPGNSASLSRRRCPRARHTSTRSRPRGPRTARRSRRTAGLPYTPATSSVCRSMPGPSGEPKARLVGLAPGEKFPPLFLEVGARPVCLGSPFFFFGGFWRSFCLLFFVCPPLCRVFLASDIEDIIEKQTPQVGLVG